MLQNSGLLLTQSPCFQFVQNELALEDGFCDGSGIISPLSLL